ncbi:hypothetical protein RCL1_002327 [Eukaryota sp. TZLM3-RCL]
MISPFDLSPASSPVHPQTFSSLSVTPTIPSAYIECSCNDCSQCTKTKQRRFAIIELCQTELRYCRDIKILEQEILLPLSELLHRYSNNTTISNAIGPVDRILASLRSIRSLNKILRRSLRCRIPESQLNSATPKSIAVLPSQSDLEDQSIIQQSLEKNADEFGTVKMWSIACVFNSITPFLKFYTSYISHFEPVTEALTEIRRMTSRSGKRLIEEINQIEGKPSLRGMDVGSYLIMPVQRVPRYRLLLEAVLKKTPTNHSDYDGVFTALERVKSVASVVNEKLKEWEVRSKIVDIERQIVGTNHGECLRLIQPHRRLIREGTVKKLCRRGTLQEKRLILFNDLMIYCGGKNLWNLGRVFESWVVTDDKTGSGFSYGITIHSSEKTFTIYGENQSDINDWRALLEEYSRAHVGLKSLSAAVWKPDNLIHNCIGCNDKFTILRRKHHCRACGEIYCSKCTRHRLIVRTETTPARVCEACFSEATSRRQSSVVNTRLSMAKGQSHCITAPPGFNLSEEKLEFSPSVEHHIFNDFEFEND